VVVGGWVEPEAELHLPAADAVGEDVGVERVRLAGHVAQELEVDLVVDLPRTFRGRLQYCTRVRIKRFHVSEINYWTYNYQLIACIGRRYQYWDLTTRWKEVKCTQRYKCSINRDYRRDQRYYVDGGDRACGVALDELDVNVDASEEVHVQGPEA
jgi:hypothetical protein